MNGPLFCYRIRYTHPKIIILKTLSKTNVLNRNARAVSSRLFNGERKRLKGSMLFSYDITREIKAKMLTPDEAETLIWHAPASALYRSTG